MWYKDMAQREEEHLERLKELQDVKSDLAGYKALVVELKGKVGKKPITYSELNSGKPKGNSRAQVTVKLNLQTRLNS